LSSCTEGKKKKDSGTENLKMHENIHGTHQKKSLSMLASLQNEITQRHVITNLGLVNFDGKI
jgi:hypothetical protein